MRNLINIFFNKSTKKHKYLKRITCCLLALSLSIVLSSCGGENKVDTPYGAIECVGKEMNTVKSDFESSGFANVSKEEICDLDITEKDKFGIVESVTINGVSDFKGNEEFKNLSKVIIKYHTFKKIKVPFSSEEIKNIDTETLMKAFKENGFVNITIEEEYDLDPDENIKIQNELKINKKNSFEKNDEFLQNAKIRIITHKPYEKYSLKVVINFLPNLLFNKHDVTLNIAGNTETIAHGKDAEFEFKLKKGQYAINFESKELSDIKGSAVIDLTGDTEVSYRISCDIDKIGVDTLYTENEGEIGENEAMIPANASNWSLKNYKDVESAFKDAGFTNVLTVPLYDIVWGWTEEGEIEKVSVNGKSEFKRGEIFPKDVEIVITYHLKERDKPAGENEAKIPYIASDWIERDYREVEKALKDAGFTNVSTEPIYDIPWYILKDGEVENVIVNGNDYFIDGDIFAKDVEIVITYYVLDKDDNTNFPGNKKSNLTIENNEDFAKLMQITDQTDSTTIKNFVSSHKGDKIEFDGCIALMMKHEDYKTRFDVCIAGGNYTSDKVYGPLFAFEDVNYYDMNVSGSDTVAEGMNFTITAKIKGFNEEGCYIILEPVALKTR